MYKGNEVLLDRASKFQCALFPHLDENDTANKTQQYLLLQLHTNMIPVERSINASTKRRFMSVTMVQYFIIWSCQSFSAP
jgi:hypothetical protein